MSQHDFQFFENLMTFFSQKTKVITYSPFVFIYFYICAKFQTKERRNVYLKMFSITLAHFEEKYMNFAYDGCHNHFLEKVVSYLVL
jgi:hypothetical protein